MPLVARGANTGAADLRALLHSAARPTSGESVHQSPSAKDTACDLLNVARQWDKLTLWSLCTTVPSVPDTSADRLDTRDVLVRPNSLIKINSRKRLSLCYIHMYVLPPDLRTVSADGGVHTA